MQTKVQVITTNDPLELQNAINRFIKDKEIIDIKYQPILYHTRDAYMQPCGVIHDRVLIIYKEKSDG